MAKYVSNLNGYAIKDAESRKQIESLRSYVEEMRTSVNQFVATVNSIYDLSNHNFTEINTLKSANETFDSTIRSLSAAIDDILNDISVIENTLKTFTPDGDVDLTEVFSQISAVEEKVANAETKIVTLETSIDENNVVVSSIQNEVNSVKTNVNGALSAISSLETEVENLKNSTPEISGDFLPLDGTAVNANKLNGKSAEYYYRVRNFLDNSDFTNPVNQRGVTEFAGGSMEYASIDRWLFYGSNANFTVSDGGIKAVNSGSTACGIVQRVKSGIVKADKIYTLACRATVSGEAYLSYGVNADEIAASSNALETSVNTIHVFTFTLGNSTDGKYNFRIRSGANSAEIDVEWMALYEGTFTADNLPPYVGKDYSAELLECQRYYKRINTVGTYALPLAYGGVYTSNTTARYALVMALPMHDTPTLSYNNVNWYMFTNGTTYTITSVEIFRQIDNIIHLEAKGSGFSIKNPASLYYAGSATSGCYIDISAEL